MDHFIAAAPGTVWLDESSLGLFLDSNNQDRNFLNPYLLVNNYYPPQVDLPAAGETGCLQVTEGARAGTGNTALELGTQKVGK